MWFIQIDNLIWTTVQKQEKQDIQFPMVSQRKPQILTFVSVEQENRWRFCFLQITCKQI